MNRGNDADDDDDRRTLIEIIARDVLEGRIFTRDPADADVVGHDVDVSNEWEMLTLGQFGRASDRNQEGNGGQKQGKLNRSGFCRLRTEIHSFGNRDR